MTQQLVVSKKTGSAKVEAVDPETKKILDFVSSALTGTGQKEYYNTRDEQRKALLEVHQPVFKKYRRFYSLLLLSQVNDLNKQIIIFNLLKHGRNISQTQKNVENKMILWILNRMRTSGAYRTLVMLAENKVNNSRTRKIITRWLKNRRNYEIEFVKYKDKVKKIIVHNHINVKNEGWDFLFKKKKDGFKSDIFNNYYAAKNDPEAMYKLPYSIAEGFAAYHKIDKAEFLEKIKGKMTDTEKLAKQSVAKKEGVKVEADWTKWELNKIYKYLYSLKKVPIQARSKIEVIAKREGAQIPYRYGKSVVIVDNSGSAYGSSEKKFHPISISLAVAKVIENISDSSEIIYTNPTGTRMIPKVEGPTNIALPLIKALKKEPDAIFILSDGYENQIAGLAGQIVNTYKSKIDKDNNTLILQISPVMAAEAHSVRELSTSIPNVGILKEQQLSGSLLLLSMRYNKDKTLKQFADFLEEKYEKLELNLSNFLLEGPDEN